MKGQGQMSLKSNYFTMEHMFLPSCITLSSLVLLPGQTHGLYIA